MMIRKKVLFICLVMCSAMITMAQVVNNKNAADGVCEDDLVKLIKIMLIPIIHIQIMI